MTPQMVARDALAGQLAPMDALVRIAGMKPHATAYVRWDGHTWIQMTDDNVIAMESPCALPAITDEVVERFCKTQALTFVANGKGFVIWSRMSPDDRKIAMIGVRAALEEFVRHNPAAIRRATEDAAGEAARASVVTPDARAHRAKLTEREAGAVAFANGERLSETWTQAKHEGWLDAQAMHMAGDGA